MKLFLVLLSVAALAAGEFVEIERYYHENIGIPEAARIKASEEAQDFDGSRITGGSASRLGQFPYMGGLVITLTTGATTVCGSSLISNNRVVGAAHCWWDGRSRARQFVVVLGSIRLFSGGTRITTTRVTMHSGWNPQNANNDVLVATISWVNFGTNINRINLASGTNNFAGVTATAVGFGRTGDGSGGAIGNNQGLSHVNVPVITNAVCQRTFGNIIVASTICISGANGRSTCGGDSGGPLVASNVLIGITSFGAAAGCTRGHPAAFARVTSFNAWIRGQM